MKMAHISKQKKQEVSLLKKHLEDYPIIGIIDLTSLPSAQLQKMRSVLKDTVLIRVTKKRLIKIVVNQLKDSIENLEGLGRYLDKCMPALLLTKEDPFRLAKKLSKTKSKAPAKPGQTAPFDIIAPAGPTKFPPGPIIGELGAAGIKAGIEEGKVAIKEDKVIAHKGDIITKKQADIMAKLDIQPMEIGLNVVAILENGLIYDRDALAINEAQVINNLKQANASALNLAVFIGYSTKETLKIMLQKAEREGKALSKLANIPTTDTIKQVLVEASTKAEAINKKVDDKTKFEEQSKVASQLIDDLKDQKIKEKDQGGKKKWN